MEIAEENVEKVSRITSTLTGIRSKIENLPEDLQHDLLFECKIIEDYMRDKFCRSGFRRNKIKKLEMCNANNT